MTSWSGPADPAASERAPLFEAATRPDRGLARRTPIRVGLVDDHDLVREGLRLVLASAHDIEVVGEAGGHQEAFELVETLRPDVLLLDLTLPEGDALPLLRVLRSARPELRILILTMDRGSESVRQAFVAGASGYVVKGAKPHELIEAIHAIARGDRYVHSSVTGAIVDDSIRWIQAGGSLSLREREVLSLLADGQSAGEIGHALGISVYTVRRHLANMSEKLGVHGQAALTRYAIRHGLARDR
jgi:DNA-binding NarL/FixJ family response regulator